jgi:hypothetical protein
MCVWVCVCCSSDRRQVGGGPGTSAADAFLKAFRCVSRAWCAVAPVRASIAVTLLLEATCEGAKPARACICDSIMLQLRKRAMPNHDLTPDIVCAGARQGPAGGVGGSPTAATRQALAGYHQVARAGVNSSGAQGAGDWGAGRVYGKANTKHMTKVAINYTGPPKSQFVAAQR